MNGFLEQQCRFKTKRLDVKSWASNIANQDDKLAVAVKIAEILTPAIRKTLPPELQGIVSVDKAVEWIG